MGRKLSEYKDATKPLTFNVLQEHWDAAVSWAVRRKRTFENCAMGVCAKRTKGVLDCRFLRNIAYVRTATSKLRYVIGGSGKTVASMLDVQKEHVTIPDSGLRVTLWPPRGVRSQQHLRSAKRRKAAKAYRAADKKKGERRSYQRTDGVTMEQLRTGGGEWL